MLNNLIKERVLLTPYTTLNIGGPARYFVEISDEAELKEACEWAEEQKLPVLTIGGGSNLLVADSGFDGLVILINSKGINIVAEESGEVYAEVSAGEVWDTFVEICVNKGYSGIECLSGIPGKVGGAVVQNIGAYGHEISESVVSVRFYDKEKREYVNCSKEGCGFAYRESLFKRNSDAIVASVKLRLAASVPVIMHKELQEKLPNGFSLKDVRQAVLDLRRSKSMVYDHSDPNSISAGSFFKNPVVSKNCSESILLKYPQAPNWPQSKGSVKLSAGWLIENSGFPKGYCLPDGRAGLSQKHTLAIINRGGATAEDVIMLSDAIKKGVLNHFDVELIPEVVFAGF